MWMLLHPEEIGIELTESFAMSPAASVSGLYFAHPKAVYFSTGKLAEDQVLFLLLPNWTKESTNFIHNPKFLHKMCYIHLESSMVA